MIRLPVVMLNGTILRMKDVALRQQSRPINIDDPEDFALAQSLVREMFRVLYSDPSGVALAAPQIGVLLQVVVISYEDKDEGGQRTMALLNPKITQSSEEEIEDKEICLSVPNLTGKVARANTVKVEGYDQLGQPVNIMAEGFFARVLQHEIDHLNGILCIDRVKGNLDNVPDFPERRTDPTMRKLGLTKKKST